MSTDTGTALEITRLIKADVETVFRAWTDPEQMIRWSCPEGVRLDGVEVDLRVGGRYKLLMVDPEGQEYTAVGEYREVDAPRRLVYTWDWLQEEHAVGDTLVTVQFNDLEGSTEVVLGHERFPSTEAKDGHEDGWGSCLTRLQGLFE